MAFSVGQKVRLIGIFQGGDPDKHDDGVSYEMCKHLIGRVGTISDLVSTGGHTGDIQGYEVVFGVAEEPDDPFYETELERVLMENV